MIGAGDRTIAARFSTRILGLIWAVWLPYLVYPVGSLLSEHPSPPRLVVTLAAALLFVAIYLWTAWHFAAGRSLSLPRVAVWVPPWLPLVALTALAVALSLGEGAHWLELFIYTSAVVGICLRRWTALAALAGLGLLTTAVALIAHQGWSSILQTLFVIAVTGICVIVMVWLVASNRELRRAREEIARLAVSEERLRFARDLHDLLGHSLSLIALKSELAGRLAMAAPERAAAEMRDVEGVARTALQEVRAAVAGYRQPTLESELRAAEEILAAAGILYSYEGTSVALPAAVEAVLSWTVREGITNVIRHSRARRCTVRLTHGGGYASVTVIDDGRGPAALSGAGHGLAGLAERVAALGGQCESGALPGGGFRLAVTVPLEGARAGERAAEAAKSA